MDNISPEMIIKQLKKKPKPAMLSLVSFIILFIIGIIGIFVFLKEDPLMKIIGVLLIFIGFFFGLILFVLYLVHMSKAKSNLRNIDFEYLKNELASGFTNYENKVYLTNNYVISNSISAFAVEYKDIVWVYKLDRMYNNYPIGLDVVINLLDGRNVSAPYYGGIIEEIEKHNPNVLVGYSSENKQLYKERVIK